jgi:hypothetical protein
MSSLLLYPVQWQESLHAIRQFLIKFCIFLNCKQKSKISKSLQFLKATKKRKKAIKNGKICVNFNFEKNMYRKKILKKFDVFGKITFS